MNEVTLTFSVADVPRLNSMYSANYRVRSRIAKDAHAAIRLSVLAQCGTDFEPFYTPVKVSVWAYGTNPRDSDASIKVLMDGLVYAGVLVDDDWRHVPDHEGHTRKCKRGEERIVVVIEPIQETET